MSATVVIRSLSRTVRSDLDETALLTAAAGGDESAFAELVRRHGPMVLGVCRRVLGPGADADDAFQTTFLSLLQHARSVRTPTALPAWLHQTACRAAVKIRARKPAPTHAPDPTIEPDPLADLSWKEVRAMLDEELNALPERLRAPVVLCFLDGRTRDDAARAIGVSLSTLKRRVADGLERLNRRLRRRGVVGGGLALTALDGRGSVAPVSAALTARVVAAYGTRTAAPGLGSSLVASGKAALAAVVLAGGLVAGAGLVTPDDSGTPLQPKEEQAGAPEGQSEEPGNPLPEGAVLRLGSVLFRHAGVRDFVLLPDGKSVLTSGSDHQLRTWDLATGRETRKVAVGASVQRVSLAPDGRYAAGWDEKNVTVFEAETGDVKRSLPAPGRNIDSVFFSPDGRTLAVLTSEPRLTLVEWPTGAARQFSLWAGRLPTDSSLHGHFSADGKWLVVGCGQWNALCVFEVATGIENYHLRCRSSRSAITHDGKALVASVEKPNGQKGSDLVSYDLKTGEEVSRFDLKTKGPFTSLDVSPDGKTIACSNVAESCLIDLRTGRVLHELSGRLHGAAFTRDGKHVVAGTGQKLRVWAVSDGKERFNRPGNCSWVLAASPGGRWLASANGAEQSVSVWDLNTGRLFRNLPLRGEEDRYVQDVHFSPDGRALWAGSNEGSVQWWDVATGKEASAIKLRNSENIPRPRYLDRVRMSTDGKTATVLEDAWKKVPSTNLVVWDVATGEMKERHSFPGHQREWAWTADGSTVALPTADGLIVIDRTDPSRARFSIRGAATNAPAAFSPDGRLLAAARAPNQQPNGGEVVLVEVAAGTVAAVLKTGPVDHLALAAGGRTLVTAGAGCLKVFDAASGDELLRRTLPVRAAALLPLDGTRAVTSLGDGTGLVWDLTAPAGRPEPSGPVLRLWNALAGTSPAAHRAAWELVDRPAEAVALLREKLKPARPADEAAVKAQIAKLNSLEFAEREAATKALQSLGAAAAPALRAALRGDLSAEQDVRIRQLLAAANAPIVPAGEPIREVRSVAILERIGTADARKLLDEWATGAPDAYLTREATAATARLKRPSNR